jgi:hypothetical protein
VTIFAYNITGGGGMAPREKAMATFGCLAVPVMALRALCSAADLGLVTGSAKGTYDPSIFPPTRTPR